ncbi:MAG: hypothetical protein ISR58_02470 [Anaerolineales bacterium]|nr:hypothetical protein [Chloroflexota bacterium]MBL6980033.1 hypothetical protein [Anaerolineales bacterium]
MAETTTEEHLETQPEAFGKPIVLTLEKKKSKKKRRYSKGFEEAQRMERHLTRSTHRMARAVEEGLSTYRKRSSQSARKKQDGAIRDFLPNSGLAMTRAMKEASPIPYDMARAMNTPESRKRLRRQLRSVSRTLRRWRW